MDVELVEVSVNGETRALTAEEADRLGKDTAGGRAVISAKGKLLSLTSGEAVRYGLAKGLADDKAGILGKIGAAEVAGESVPGLSDSIVSVLTSASVQTILILLALVMVFLEINTPGFGIPGVTAIIAFALVFGSSALLGRVDSLEIVLFLLGIVLLAVELFIIPGFGLVGISGFILIGLSLVLSMQDFVIPRIDWEWNLLGRNAAVVFIGLVAAIVGIAIIALLGPRIRLFDRFTLQTRISDTSGGHGIPDEDAKKSAVQSVASDYQRLVGKTGVAATVLRPSGFIEIEDEVFSAEAEGSFVDPGRGVKVTKVNGNRITVRLV
jgi:membrane-bound serine protease (ClpP class)